MNEEELQGLIVDLRGAADARGAAIRAEFGKPVSQEALDRCSEFLSRELPSSLVALLSEWNGIAVYYYDESDVVVERPDCWSVKFEILSAELMIKATAGIRDAFDLGAPDPAERRKFENVISNLLVLSEEADFVR
jgi:hypothetical protein